MARYTIGGIEFQSRRKTPPTWGVVVTNKAGRRWIWSTNSRRDIADAETRRHPLPDRLAKDLTRAEVLPINLVTD